MEMDRMGRSLLVCVLGPFQMRLAGVPVAPLGPKAQELMTALALRPQFMASRDFLLNLLWPETDPTLAGQSLNSLAYGLRKQLSRFLGGAAPVVHDAAAYRLNTAAGIEVDRAAFEAAMEAGEAAKRAGDQPATLTAYRGAVEFYHGDLCTTDLDTLIQRERLRAKYLTMLASLADNCYETGNPAEALDYAMRLLATDPCREDAHRMVMRCHLRAGARSQALHQYRLCLEMLQTEFGMLPEPATTALFDRIRFDSANV